MSANVLKLNSDEAEFILIGSPKRVAKVQHFELTVGDSVVRPHASARILGVMFDDTLSFKQFCLKSAAVATFHIRSHSKFRDHLSRDLTSRQCTPLFLVVETLFFLSNSLLAGLPKCSVRPLQLLKIWHYASYLELGCRITSIVFFKSLIGCQSINALRRQF